MVNHPNRSKQNRTYAVAKRENHLTRWRLMEGADARDLSLDQARELSRSLRAHDAHAMYRPAKETEGGTFKFVDGRDA